MPSTKTFLRHTRLLALSLALPATLLAYSNIACADSHDHHGDWHHDDWHHDDWRRADVPRFRPGIGVTIDVLPPAPRVVVYGHDHYYFSGGVWYRPYGPRFIVVAPPIGVVIPFLPAYYDTRIIGGDTYYISDGTYYRATPHGDGYIVTTPPDSAPAASAAPNDKVFVYPRNGQSQKQQDKDRYECHAWAMDQSGFDPTLAHGGVASNQVDTKGEDYHRAMEACLDGRGYTVK
jgi:hypothetical protein